MLLRYAPVVATAAACLLSLSGCSVTETGNPATAKGTILPQIGGSLTLEAAKVEFDPGDLPGEAAIEVTMTRTTKAVPSDYQGFSALYDLEPSMVLDNPVKVCLPATDAPGDAAIYWSRQSSDGDNSRFDHIPTTIAADVACAEVAHFGRGFVGRPATDAGLPSPDAGTPDAPPQWTGRKLDLLFVVDDSKSMQQEQENLQRNFARMVEALRTHGLGPDGSGRPCTATNTSGCRIPDLHIGVISPDLGAGAYSTQAVVSCADEGDEGRGGYLQNIASVPDCPQPSDPWISYAFDTQAAAGQTNVGSGSEDPIERVKESFACVAALGVNGCGLEHPLQAAKLALDPQQNRNPGFVRKDALLAVVFVTDEDDCSAADDGLFDFTNLDLGPANFRCFEYGVQCDGIMPGENAREAGQRTGCTPGFEWLERVTGSDDSYEAFFKGLKTAGGVVLAALAGPADPVVVELATRPGSVLEPMLMPSCEYGTGDAKQQAFPAIRIKALVDSMGAAGQFTSICTDDFGPALETLGKKIASTLDAP